MALRTPLEAFITVLSVGVTNMCCERGSLAIDFISLDSDISRSAASVISTVPSIRRSRAAAATYHIAPVHNNTLHIQHYRWYVKLQNFIHSFVFSQLILSILVWRQKSCYFRRHPKVTWRRWCIFRLLSYALHLICFQQFLVSNNISIYYFLENFISKFKFSDEPTFKNPLSENIFDFLSVYAKKVNYKNWSSLSTGTCIKLKAKAN